MQSIRLARPQMPSLTLARARTVLRRDIVLQAAAVALVALLAYAIVNHDTIDALAAMTGRESRSEFNFGGVGTYLNRLRDALIPLAVPIGTLALIACGALLFFGNQMARGIGGGVILGLGLVFFSPQIMA